DMYANVPTSTDRKPGSPATRRRAGRYDDHLMAESRRVVLSFPCDPTYLRLARLATSDAGSRAGFDFEEIDDIRIAVSELCSAVATDAGGSMTLEFRLEDGALVIEGSAPGSTDGSAFAVSE